MKLVDQETANSIAIDYATQKGETIVNCQRIQHISKEEYDREVGPPHTHGNYLVELTIIRDYSPDKCNPVEQMLPVLVNDVTREATIMTQL
ncbi:hypothetical protein Pla110_15210 [Polystyrenella longa]|uniref:Uncharacterized protein n=1 Tax=Polystyrenella longa TaxID=2528007 RepID=A0A518CKP9_9PLAN|nr:hypothetical protein [Polystyrenella longa]QDU79803.1 hypothetical protein Pla110_15210 [Polystyrenella longa]